MCLLYVEVMLFLCLNDITITCLKQTDLFLLKLGPKSSHVAPGFVEFECQCVTHCLALDIFIVVFQQSPAEKKSAGH